MRLMCCPLAFLVLTFSSLHFSRVAAEGTSTEASTLCQYDYKILPVVSGNIDYTDPPIRIVQQSDSTVKFSVKNTWNISQGGIEGKTLDQLFVYSTKDNFGSVRCTLEENVATEQTIRSDGSSVVFEAYCSSSKVAFVNLYVQDSTFVVDGSKTTEIPGCCHDPSSEVPKHKSLFEYVAVVNCSPTCLANGDEEETADSTEQLLEEQSGDTEDSSAIFTPPKIMKLPLPLPEEDPVVLEFNDGDSFDLDLSSANESPDASSRMLSSGQDSLSILFQMSVDKDGNITGGFVPVGRSYNGNPWENYANALSTSVYFDCKGSSSCRVTPPLPAPGRAYVLKSFEYSHSLSEDDLKARFLERTTFGPTKSEIDGFLSPEEWLEEQFSMNMTSHRQFYRKRATHWHLETNSKFLLDSGPCDETARYRRFAFLTKDDNRYLEIKESPYDSSKLILSIDGKVRTVVDGPLQWTLKNRFRLRNITPQGMYKICNLPFEGVGGRFLLHGSGLPGCNEIYFNGVYGNPAVNFDELHRHLVEHPIVTLDSSAYKEIMKPFFFQGKTEILELTSNLETSACNISDAFVAGLPERVIIAQTDDSVNGTQYWIHSTTIKLERNVLDDPLSDGGNKAVVLTQTAPAGRFQALCSNPPRTFLNEDSCQLSEDACSFKESPDGMVELSIETLQKIHEATGGKNGKDTRYVYAMTSLRNDLRFTDPPCTPGARSRWIISDDCALADALWNEKTRSSFELLLKSSSDTNPFLRDIFFPETTEGSIACHVDDISKFDFKIEIGGKCYENTHPDNLQVFDMTSWTTDAHPGNSRENKIKAFADTIGTWYLTYPESHDMDRWHKKMEDFPIVGRLGDTTTLKSFPASLQQENIGHAFGHPRSIFSKVLVCGSPFEVENVKSENSGPLHKGGFDMLALNNNTEFGFTQRRTVWYSIALWSRDQLRQRTAFALSQIFALSPEEEKHGTEGPLGYYDIFVRHAFGNYFDIMKEVTYHPLMARFLTYNFGVSTAYSHLKRGSPTAPDENYAREVMQLFSIGLKMLNSNGTIQVNDDGSVPFSYTNEDIAEYAKVYVGFWPQSNRGNVEQSQRNTIDPMHMVLNRKDYFPKMGMNSKYIGDGYPLCSDLPPQHFLKQGAIYRLIGGDPNPELVSEDFSNKGLAPIRVSLNFSASDLALALCNGNGTRCNPQAKTVLAADIPCNGIECSIYQPRSLEVAEGIWFEYVRPPCVNKAVFNDGKSIAKLASAPWGGKVLCGNPEVSEGSTLCCRNRKREKLTGKYDLFSGERLPLDVSSARCSDADLFHCRQPRNWYTLCHEGDNGGCDGQQYYWTSTQCHVGVKIGIEGRVAIIHGNSLHRNDPYRDIHSMVKPHSNSFFRVDWSSSNIDDFLSDYAANCISLGCFIDDSDGVCQCAAHVDDTLAFADESEIGSVENILKIASIGAFPPPASFSPTSVNGVQKHPSGALSEDTIFRVTDSNGQIQYRKNLVSAVKLGNGDMTFRNAVTFWSLSELTHRDARYELDAALEHYFYHQNVAPFVAYRLAQRFGTSNPSPRYIDAIATAFRSGIYKHRSKSFGSRRYGCLQATVAAIVLDREAQDHILDTDPISGHLQEPLIKLMRIYRSLDFAADADNPLPRLFPALLGQAAHDIPNVFSFFRPQYSPPGRVSTAGMVSPESQILDGPKSVDGVNMYLSHLKYGSSNCYHGIGGSKVVANGWTNLCVIGNNTFNLGNNKYLPSTYGLDDTSADEVVDDLSMLLTSGRIVPEHKELMKKIFNETLEAGKGTFEAMVNVQQLMVVSPEFHTTGLVRKTSDDRVVPEKSDATDKPYKAIIYVMLGGGMDSFNVIVPESCSGKNSAGETVDEQYLKQRGSVAFDRKKGEFDLRIKPNTEQPCESFAVNKNLAYMKELYDEGDLVFLANTGNVYRNGMTKKNYRSRTVQTHLFDHAGMQHEAKTVDPYNDFDGTGVLGRAKDILATKGHVVDSMSIGRQDVAVEGTVGMSLPVNVVSVGGVRTFAPRPHSEKDFDIEECTKKMNSETNVFSNVFGETWSNTFVNGIKQGSTLGKLLDDVSLDSSIWKKRDGRFFDMLETISKVIKTRTSRTVDRDVFFTSHHGFDHHSDTKTRLDADLNEVDTNLKKLVLGLKKDNLWDHVTIVVASEFARTITPNTNGGTDHAWGGNYWILGGQVKGGRIVGKYPADLTANGPLNTGTNTRVRFMPTTSWDSVWNGIVQWFGVEDEQDLDYILPNRKNTITPVVGVGEFPLLNKTDLFEDEKSARRKLRQ